MIVTTTYRAGRDAQERGRALAREIGAQFVVRGRRTVPDLLQRTGQREAFIYGDRHIRYVSADGADLHYHPSLSMVRIKRLLAGEDDPLVAAARIRPGDRVIDCTMGLASDAVLLAHAVGEEGRVTAIESERVLYVLAREGLAMHESGLPELDAAMRRVRAVHADHLDYLRRLPDKSVDVVYFDPMFRHSGEGAAIGSLRPLANSGKLRSEAVMEARRAARRCVVLKEHTSGGEFERLGFAFRSGWPRIAYGVIDCD